MHIHEFIVDKEGRLEEVCRCGESRPHKHSYSLLCRVPNKYAKEVAACIPAKAHVRVVPDEAVETHSNVLFCRGCSDIGVFSVKEPLIKATRDLGIYRRSFWFLCSDSDSTGDTP